MGYVDNLEKLQAESLRASSDVFEVYIDSIGTEELREKYYGIMLNAAGDMEAAINSVYVSGIRGLAAEIRKHEKNYMLDGDESHVAAACESVSNFVEAFENSKVESEYVCDVRQASRVYKCALAALAAEDKKISDYSLKIEESACEMEPIAASIASTVLKRSESRGAVVEQARSFEL
ncbi:MAG: hypothetical protein FVQ80_08430 [Planctomycetes bacterium]|nr:hypothetical protein [Planctomycetota bacterium]